MKHIIILSIACLVLAGCANEQSNKNQQIQQSFPKELVGTWKANKQNWQFEFDADGKIKNFTHFFGAITLFPERTMKTPLSLTEFSIYDVGECIADYNPEVRELAVKVELTNIEYTNMIKGSSVDFIVGKVSNDWTTWQTEWISQLEIYAVKDGNDPVRIPNDKAFDNPMPLTFRKILDNDLEEVKKK